MCIDHIHMCLLSPPKNSVSTIVEYLKGKSGMIIFEKYSRLKRNFKAITFGLAVIISLRLVWMKPRFVNILRIKRLMNLSKINTIMI